MIEGKKTSRAKSMGGALFFIFLSTLCVAAPIIGSACLIKWLYYPSHQISSVNSSIKKTDQVLVASPKDDREEFSRSDLITVVLSAVSVILTAVTIALAVLGLFGYKVITSKAEKEARRVAKKHAEDVAKKASEEIIPIVVDEFLKLEKTDDQDYSEFFGEGRGEGRK